MRLPQLLLPLPRLCKSLVRLSLADRTVRSSRDASLRLGRRAATSGAMGHGHLGLTRPDVLAIDRAEFSQPGGLGETLAASLGNYTPPPSQPGAFAASASSMAHAAALTNLP